MRRNEVYLDNFIFKTKFLFLNDQKTYQDKVNPFTYCLLSKEPISEVHVGPKSNFLSKSTFARF